MKYKNIQMVLVLTLILTVLCISLKEDLFPVKPSNHPMPEATFIPNLITGAPVGTLGVTILSAVTISLPVDVVNFSDMYPGDVDTTVDDDPLPFLIQNDGTVFVNVTIGATDLFNGTNASNPSDYYGFKIDSESDGPYSVLDWTSMPAVSNATLAIHALEYSDTNDTAEVEIGLDIPPDESAGDKNSLVTFTAIDAS